MVDSYKEQFDKLIGLVPKLKSWSQRNQITGSEYWGEVPSGSPIVPRQPELKFGAPGSMDSILKYADASKKMAGKNFVTNPNFKFLTNYEHVDLMNNWADGGHKTSCNAFVGHVTFHLGLPGFGGFYVRELLEGMGKGDYWVTPKDGERPRYGDLFETRSHNAGGYENLHVGFSLQIEGDNWWTVEGGQGGSILGYDRVARVKKTFKVDNLLGWVDMRQLLGHEPILPRWLRGTWAIIAGDKRYFYQIDRLGGVKELPFAPASSGVEPPPIDTADITWSTPDMLKLNWHGEQGIETITYDRANSTGFIKRLTGVSGTGVPFTGVRLSLFG